MGLILVTAFCDIMLVIYFGISLAPVPTLGTGNICIAGRVTNKMEMTSGTRLHSRKARLQSDPRLLRYCFDSQ